MTQNHARRTTMSEEADRPDPLPGAPYRDGDDTVTTATDPSEDESQCLAEDFQRRRRNQLLSITPFLGVLAAMLFSGSTDLSDLLGITNQALVPIIGGAILSFFAYSLYNWRCPACNRYLGQRMNPKQCSGCGIRLSD
jgi:hypothetical protein